jgi:OOP family OmpA-OmpF porin
MQAGALTLNGEAFFGFNRYSLTPNAMQKIDAFLADLQGAPYKLIVVTGHADRIGSDRYNRQLSEQRALQVKRYLGTKGVQTAKIETNAVGAMEPATAPGACEGLSREETIACLAPDRRVELEVVGMAEQ